MMNRRDVLAVAVTAAVPLTALPEVSLPRTAEERLQEAVKAWVEADAALANLTRTYESARQLIWTGMLENAPGRALKAQVEGRRQAREEMEAGQRALVDAERKMEACCRMMTEARGNGRG